MEVGAKPAPPRRGGRPPGGWGRQDRGVDYGVGGPYFCSLSPSLSLPIRSLFLSTLSSPTHVIFSLPCPSFSLPFHPRQLPPLPLTSPDNPHPSLTSLPMCLSPSPLPTYLFLPFPVSLPLSNHPLSPPVFSPCPYPLPTHIRQAPHACLKSVSTRPRLVTAGVPGDSPPPSLSPSLSPLSPSLPIHPFPGAHLLKVSLHQAAAGHGGRPNAHAARGERAKVAQHGVLVQGDVALIAGLLQLQGER